ncbi:FAD/NAD(P)-binding domain-containing protein [Streptomyces sp. SAJ15]|uniref:FAD/NAD(P)-binding protein n=1 Tax=Streptomyces sp. SAJ15 TaxID=2011095 RepID=UPI001184E2D7|nr:FAD/NAD(P)-binding protein [Streptomyces sp. SAJ15]TVL91732.1 FAD-binding protein [Streptomyces sp. SAJ15]
MSGIRLDVCLIGAGPRGLSVLERLCAGARRSRRHRAITVHVVDPYPPGAGRVWRTDQSRRLLMNTVACQVTVFTDESVELAGPLEPGPSLYEWAGSPAAAETLDGAARAEARALGPDTYPTRALYGAYLEWAFRRVAERAPDQVALRVHRQRAVDLDDVPGASGPGPDDGRAGTQTVTLADGTRLTGLHAVVLAQGHVDPEPSAVDAALGAFAAEHGLLHLPPANPADLADPIETTDTTDPNAPTETTDTTDTALAALAPGEPVLLRGLGLTFFDHMALLTEGRGGRYETRDGRLVYVPSGREPLLYAGSRRGLPYHARGENEKGVSGRHEPLLLTPELIAKLRAQSPDGSGLDFRETLWPLIAKEVEAVYYTALLTARGRPDRAWEFRERFLACPPGGEREDWLLTEAGVAPGDRWDWAAVQRPHGDRRFTDPEDFHRWLADHLRADLAAARAGNVTGPLKAALDVLRDLRNEIRLAVDHGGLDGDSHRVDLDGWYTPLNAYLSIGPPAHRIAELLALLEAGVVRIIGPDTRIRAEPGAAGPGSGRFVAESPAVPGSTVAARALIEARLPEPDLRRTADPLLRRLLATGRCRPYRVPAARGGALVTGGLAVTARPYRVLDAAGRPHPARFAYGVPTEAVHWVTAAGIRPGVNSVTLGDADAIAQAVLALGGPAPEGPAAAVGTTDADPHPVADTDPHAAADAASAARPLSTTRRTP